MEVNICHRCYVLQSTYWFTLCRYRSSNVSPMLLHRTMPDDKKILKLMESDNYWISRVDENFGQKGDIWRPLVSHGSIWAICGEVEWAWKSDVAIQDVSSQNRKLTPTWTDTAYRRHVTNEKYWHRDCFQWARLLYTQINYKRHRPIQIAWKMSPWTHMIQCIWWYCNGFYAQAAVCMLKLNCVPLVLSCVTW